MTWLSDAIVIDTAELREAAAALRQAERGIMELGLRLPREVWPAPDWLASSAAEGLGLARRELNELGDELRLEAKRLEARAAEVDGAEQRWWEIGNGDVRCGCILPSGAVVAQPGQYTATSSASGAGTDDPSAFIGVGAISAAAGAGLGVSVVGGSPLTGLDSGLIIGQAPSVGYGTSTVGGDAASLYPNITYIGGSPLTGLESVTGTYVSTQVVPTEAEMNANEARRLQEDLGRYLGPGAGGSGGQLLTFGLPNLIDIASGNLHGTLGGVAPWK